MVLALAGTDGCGALYPQLTKGGPEWLQNPAPNRPQTAARSAIALDAIQSLCRGSKGRFGRGKSKRGTGGSGKETATGRIGQWRRYDDETL